VQADLMLALGVRFDDRVTGKLEAFATHARIVHIDVDPAEIHKNKHAHIPICAGGSLLVLSLGMVWFCGGVMFVG
jgi:acetolactate synthase-1/2/3 large subunit